MWRPTSKHFDEPYINPKDSFAFTEFQEYNTSYTIKGKVYQKNLNLKYLKAAVQIDLICFNVEKNTTKK